VCSSDLAELLRSWENWNRSAYFLMSERSVFIGNAYERELDATHPRAGEHELMVIQKDGSPLGLLKLRPGASSGLGEAFVYFRDPAGNSLEFAEPRLWGYGEKDMAI